MRSRFTANKLAESTYLQETWWPATCPDISEDPDVDWIGLHVHDSGDQWLSLEELPSLDNIISTDLEGCDIESGWVHFSAFFTTSNSSEGSSGVHVLEEWSRFIKLLKPSPLLPLDYHGRWLYVDGKTHWRQATMTRNTLCPCGSGKKWKRCHGK